MLPEFVTYSRVLPAVQEAVSLSVTSHALTQLPLLQ